MRGTRRSAVALAVVWGLGGCQLVAGIQDLRLTGDASDATTGDGGDELALDGPGGDSSGGPDVAGEGAMSDARADSSPVGDSGGLVDGPPDAPFDAPPDTTTPIDAGLTYAQVVMSDKPMAFWRFDETSGTTAVDSSGNGNDGTYVGSVALGKAGIVGDPGTSVGFDGATTWMDAGNIFAFTGTTPCSFEAWVNPVTDTYYHNVLSRSDGQGGTTTGYLMYIEPAAAPALMDFAHYLGGASNIAESDTPIATGAFTHLVGVYDGSSLYLYANGTLMKQNAATIGNPATVNGFIVGAQSGGVTSWFNGEIDDVAVYGTPLSQGQIVAHYNKGIGM